MLSALYRITWQKIRLVLANTRNTFAKEPPVSILQSVLKRAATREGSHFEGLFFFHPLGGPLPRRVHRNARYEIEVVFPAARQDEILSFVENLRLHLADPANNFTLLETEGPRQRDLEAVLAENPLPEGGGREICLDFLTPFPFAPKATNRPWLLSREEFFKGFTARLQALYGLSLPGAEVLWRDARVLPYYWHYTDSIRHQAKSTPGEKIINGAVGPLYLKGDLAPIYPLLALCSELHAGSRVPFGQGYYRLESGRAHFDRMLADPELFRQVWLELLRESDAAESLAAGLVDPDGFLDRLRQEVLDGTYAPGACRVFPIPKRREGTRLIGALEPRDSLAQRALHRMLSPVLDRMFEDASVGFRRSRSRETARAMIVAAYREGFRYALESDVASFFDQVDWDLLAGKLDDCLPAADRLTRSLLQGAVRMPAEQEGEPLPREKGLLQGSPLSPLLANLYLDSLDEEMERRGHRLVRYADDFLVLVRDLGEGERALADVREILSTLGLGLKEEKTTFQSLDMGFRFLGLDLDPGLDEEFVEQTALRKPLFIRQQYAFVGVDTDTLVVRKGADTLARLPLKRIGEIVVFGTNVLSTRLVHKCAREGIPISFCSPAGYYMNTLRPDSKRFFDAAARHAEKHASLSPRQLTETAARIVIAKIANYLGWIADGGGPAGRALAATLEERVASVSKCLTVEQVRGYEGEAARLVFEFVNARVRGKGSEFQSRGREKRKKADRFNSLLDFAYFLLFTRLNVLVRGQGLNPYLGILHSHKDYFESFVCDLEEPFRCRVDRLVVKLVNRGEIKPDDFEIFTQNGQEKGYRLKSEAVGTFIEAFERELATRLGGDGGTLQQLLAAQARAARSWVEGTGPLAIYRARVEEQGAESLG